VNESGMIRAQMGMHNRSVRIAVYGTPSAIHSIEVTAQDICVLSVNGLMIAYNRC
jgi:hypothetical protein